MSLTEDERLNLLRQANILDTPPTEEFDAIVRLACSMFDMPMALVSFVDGHRQWFKAEQGLFLKETPREHSFCSHIVETKSPLIVENADKDSRFSGNTFVRDRSVRFYAGVPLSEGETCYGSFCVLDTKNRRFSGRDLEQLRSLASVVVGLIREHRQQNLLREQQRELELKQARFEQTERSAKVGGFEMDLATGTIIWSDQIYRTVGLPVGKRMTSEEVIGCYAPEERESVRRRIRDVLDGSAGGIDREYRIMTPEGEERWVRVVSDIERLSGKPSRLFGIVQDVSEKVRYEQRLLQAANADPLTGLANRAAYNAHMERLTAADAPSIGLLLIDVDRLKQVNDILGHATGDLLLKGVASRLDERLGKRGKVFRLGGDEFSVILDAPASLRRMGSIARHLIEFIGRPLEVGGSTINPAITVGGAISEGEMDAATLSQNADFALYHAKETRRGSYVHYEPSLRSRIARRIQIIREVESALTEDRMVPHYQPIVGCADGQVSAFEALVRMQRSDGSIVSAGQFHEAFTDPSVAHHITTRMLEQVAADIRSWIDRDLEFGRVALNISASDFMRGDLETRIVATFASKGIPLDKLVLEVTETVFLQGLEETVATTLQRLRKKGLTVALDDFGTGYASLTHLRSLPVDVIKIDKSFIDTMLVDESSLAIVELVLNLARKLDMKVTAEGVESHRQAMCLLEKGCTTLQGYLFGKPMSRERVGEYLRARKPGMTENADRPKEEPRRLLG
ncbi:EAL domain-containing protein [Rhizobium lentis]|uniref:EAL domain-containing protein n=1 Tax=Rhizobium lentis TaxID=1138194 RepID=A0A9Q3ME39_9HYPH|nr:EAL domain-containing protein [Rhizobium lentis]MBX4956747.1 EAL domain-containing protein [Rhizobium lentis]MBX4975530.1 EAL domain-containing protein [Rhizobium lentis]MBX4986444.1 EAL domain-containing protein [Rhizobium lentis]MBX4999299.1 EAL domain-containing protein [Rhizobium lentis]MBX5004888.1 EAL domain-containing protein [Rhizobium lentis]